MVDHIVNFNFEDVLFGGKKSKFDEFEYIYLWVELAENRLVSKHNYSEEYLNFLKLFRKKIPVIIKTSEKSTNWWGDSENPEYEREINSKLTSTKIAMENGWAHPETTIVSSFEEVQASCDKSEYSRWIAKDPYGFSGRGNFIFDRAHLNSDTTNMALKKMFKKSEKIVLDPCLKRTLDIGSWFELEEGNVLSEFSVQNFIDKRGAFKGALAFHHRSDLDETRELLKPVIQKFNEKYSINQLEIDSFRYLEDGELKHYVLVEVNHRKTMGYFVHRMLEHVPENGVGAWFLFSRKNMKSIDSFNEKLQVLGDGLYSFDNKTGIIPTSDSGRIFETFFCSGKNLKDIQFQIKKVWELFRKEDAPLPTEFIINF